MLNLPRRLTTVPPKPPQPPKPPSPPQASGASEAARTAQAAADADHPPNLTDLFRRTWRCERGGGGHPALRLTPLRGFPEVRSGGWAGQVVPRGGA